MLKGRHFSKKPWVARVPYLEETSVKSVFSPKAPKTNFGTIPPKFT